MQVPYLASDPVSRGRGRGSWSPTCTGIGNNLNSTTAFTQTSIRVLYGPNFLGFLSLVGSVRSYCSRHPVTSWSSRQHHREDAAIPSKRLQALPNISYPQVICRVCVLSVSQAASLHDRHLVPNRPFNPNQIPNTRPKHMQDHPRFAEAALWVYHYPPIHTSTNSTELLHQHFLLVFRITGRPK